MFSLDAAQKATKSKFLSRSGYILPDVFSELRTKLLKQDEATTTASQIEQLCYWSAELVCSGKVKQVVSMLVDLYSTCFISKSLGFVERFTKSLDTIQNERYNPKSTNVQAAVCTLVIMLARQTPSRNPRSFATSLSISHQCFIDGLQRPADIAASHVLRTLGEGFIDCSILHILIHFWQSLLECDASKACCIIDYVTQKTKKLNVCGGCLSITIGMPKAMQNDSVWVLWQLLLEYPRYQNNLRRLIQAHFIIYKIEYSAANRKDRLNLLYACVLVHTTKKQISDHPFEDKVILQALEHLDEIYRMIMGKPQRQQQRRQQQSKGKASPPVITSSSSSSSPDDFQKEKLQALFCYTFVKPAAVNDGTLFPTKDQARAQSQQLQPQYKELDLQCGSWNPLANDAVTVQKLDALVPTVTSHATKSEKTSHGYQPLSNRDRLRSAT
jgi:hypothetical protein